MTASRLGLERLLRIRKEALDTSQRALAASLAAEAEAEAMLRAAEEAIRREHGAAVDLASTDTAVEAYARWLPLGLRARRDAEASVLSAQASSTHARAHVTSARSAVEAVSKLLDAQLEAERLSRDRRAQAALDEIAQRRAREGARRP
ncbi:MAG TPA: flagellar FliJ family protein [Acetobacteraceae bacterium]|jgi:flagellar export protein FliJ|nr:flagellar FliJ family protein [Acetobacteraceae bacterium]